MAKNTSNTITLSVPDEQLEMLTAIFGPAILTAAKATKTTTTVDRPRGLDGRFLPAKAAKKAGKAGSKATVKAGKKAAKKAKADKSEKFVAWLKDTAEARHARQSSNAEMAKWMRSKGLVPNGTAWELCKKGERSVTVLRKANKADEKAKQA